jgi:hypothetical protein
MVSFLQEHGRPHYSYALLFALLFLVSFYKFVSSYVYWIYRRVLMDAEKEEEKAQHDEVEEVNEHHSEGEEEIAQLSEVEEELAQHNEGEEKNVPFLPMWMLQQ